jgi:hypothetical protein
MAPFLWTELAWRAIDVMDLDLGEVVGDVIEKRDLMGADRVEERRDLVTQASRSAMDHYADLT